MGKPFKFKQFSIYQDQCAMKVGTDGILLGAWTSTESNPNSILDIGAGTGLLSLILAQRSSTALIKAIEIDHLAYQQCTRNFEQSPWSSRLISYHYALDRFTKEVPGKYDLIISNPPFYSENYKSDNSQRDIARFQDAMPFAHLTECTASLLSGKGVFSVIIPFSEEKHLIDLAAKSSLHPRRITRTRGTPASNIKRSLLEFSFSKGPILEAELIIELSRHVYTDDFIQLTRDLYLHM